MALNKAQTSTLTKVFIWVLIFAFVGSITGALVNGLLLSGNSSNQATQSDKLAAIATRYKGQTDALNQKLATNPKDYNTLVELGDTYSNWTVEVLQASPESGAYQPISLAGADFYRRALALKSSDASVTTDYAISLFYGGQAEPAISALEGLIKKQPKFPPAYFNLGVFYQSTNQNAKALTAFQTALKLDPNSQSAAAAKDFIAKLQNAAPSGAPTAGP